MNIPFLILLLFTIFIQSLVNVHGYSKAPPRLALPKSKTNPVIYLVGSKVQLQCPVYADPKRLFVEWMRNNMPVEHIHRYFVTLNGFLRIEFAQLEDSGVYTCKAANGFGSVYANITLSILRQEDLGQSGQIQFDNVNRLLLSDDYSDDLSSSSSSLQSSYSSALSSSTLSQYTNYVEDEHQGPYFLGPIQTKQMKLNSGKTLRLRCNVAGKPRPEIAWYKNGMPLKLNRLPEGSSRTYGILNIPGVRIQDSGYYMCVASNSKGRINTTFDVTISDKVNRPEIVGINPENNTVLLGQHTYFDCQFRSKLEPVVRWLKEVSPEQFEDEEDENQGILVEIGGEYFRSLKSSAILHKRDGIYYNRLIIDSVDRSDSGKYLCSVVNYKGYAYRASFLTVVTSIEMNQLRDLGLPGINYCTLLIIVIAIIGCIVLVIFFTFFLYENRGGGRQRDGVLGLKIGRRGLETNRIGGGKNGSRIEVPGLDDGGESKSHLFPSDSLAKTDPSVKFPISGHLYQPSFYHHHVKHLQPPTPKFQSKPTPLRLSSSSSSSSAQSNVNQQNHYSRANDYTGSYSRCHYSQPSQHRHKYKNHHNYNYPNSRSVKEYASYQKLTNAVIEITPTASSNRSLGIV